MFPRAIVLTFSLLHCTWCECRVAAVECIPVHHHSAIFLTFFVNITPRYLNSSHNEIIFSPSLNSV